MASFEDVLENYENLDTAAGFTFPGKKKHEVVEENFFLSRFFLHKLKYGMKVY